jgi:hypothetical protein
MIWSYVACQQVDFLRRKLLGFDRDHILGIPIFGTVATTKQDHFKFSTTYIYITIGISLKSCRMSQAWLGYVPKTQNGGKTTS